MPATTPFFTIVRDTRTVSTPRPQSDDNLFASTVFGDVLSPGLRTRLSAEVREELLTCVTGLAETARPDVSFSRFDERTIATLPSRRRLGGRSYERSTARRLARSVTLQKAVAKNLDLRLYVGTPATAPKTALALSGGAFKGSFEVGWLDYFERLWDSFAIDCVIGTSVGSVNAAALAAFGKGGIEKLVNLWLGLKGDADMYVRHPSVTSADMILRTNFGVGIDELLAGQGLDGLKQALISEFIDEAVLAGSGLAAFCAGAAAGGPVGMLVAGLGILFGCIGASQGVAAADAKVKAGKAAVDVLMAAPGLYEFAPLQSLLQNELQGGAIGSPGRPKLRLAMVSLEDGQPYYFTEKCELKKGDLSGPEDSWNLANSGSMVQMTASAVLASSSPPAFFPPVRLAQVGAAAVQKTGLFIDGGIRETLPLRAAYEMGYKRVVAVLTSPPKVANWSASNFSAPTIAEVGLRTLPIMLDEVIAGDLAEGDRRSGVETRRIYPMTEVFNDAFSVDPGLIRINMAYGYITAFLSTLDEAGKNIGLWNTIFGFLAGEAIVELRLRTWNYEAQAVLHPIGALDETLLGDIRNTKRKILEWVEILYDIDPDAVPITFGAGSNQEHVRSWWLEFERHKTGTPAAVLNGRKAFDRQLVVGPTGTPATAESSTPATPVPDPAALR